MSWTDSYGTSPGAIAKRQRQAAVRAMTNGRCFYCGNPTVHRGDCGDRDWLLDGDVFRMVEEHMTPTSRGGSRGPENCVPACVRCNQDKSSLTLDEYRLVVALRRGDLDFTFHGEQPVKPRRDWLCCHSAPFARHLLLHNFPAASTFGRK